MLSFANTAFSANGDIIGDYYFTDIKVYIYRAPVTAYNIGGKTMLDAEILNWHFGFDVYWKEESRTLEIFDKGGRFNSLQALNGEFCESLNGKLEEIAGKYYETDIKAYLNGEEITSCNIGGRTCISAEEMANHGYEVIWDAEERTLKINKPADFYKLETNIGTIKTVGNTKRETTDLYFEEAPMTWYDDETQKSFSTLLPSKKVLWVYNVQFVKLSDIAEITGGISTLSEELINTENFYYNKEYNHKISLDFEELPKLNAEEKIVVPKTERKTASINRFEYDFFVNGEHITLQSIMGGCKYKESFLLYDGELYIPSYTAAKILFCKTD